MQLSIKRREQAKRERYQVRKEAERKRKEEENVQKIIITPKKQNSMEYIKKMKELIAVVDIFRDHGSLTMKEFNEIWNGRVESKTCDVNRKTFARYLSDISDMFGIRIECGKRYKYKITNEDIFDGNTTGIWLYRTFTDISNLMDGMAVSDRIVADRKARGWEWMRTVIVAMKRNRMIALKYRRFKGKQYIHMGAPYCLKEYQNTWYVALKKPDIILTLALDRVEEIELTDEEFVMDPDFDSDEFYRNYFGVYTDERLKPERVVLRVYADEGYYMMSNPWHHSQRLIAGGEHYQDFEFKICLTRDFIGKIISRQDRVEVMAPAHFREEIKTLVSKIQALYV